MLAPLLHRIVAIPAVYDFVQWAVGGGRVYARMTELAGQRRGGWALDVGGGTGLLRDVVRTYNNYVCVDLDSTKLHAFRARTGGRAIVANATDLPLSAASADMVLCTAVSHHLTDSVFRDALGEMRRVLRPDGQLLFVDGVLRPDLWVSRLLWRYDRGSQPRTKEMLTRAILEHFTISHIETMKVHHEYVIMICDPR